MKFRKIAALTLALSFSFAGPSLLAPQTTTAYASDRLELGVDTGKVAYKENTFTLNQNEAKKQEALKQVKDLRSKMWDENVIYTLNEKGNPRKERLQDVAKANGYTNKSDYVNGLSWATELEKIAVQRIFEQTLTGLSHTRPDGSMYSTAVTKSGVRPYGEILANNTAQMTPDLSFNQWSHTPRKSYGNKSEYQLLIEAQGVSNNGNGHLHLLLNPVYKTFAYADLTSSKTDRNFAVGLFGFRDGNSNSKSVNLVGEYRLYVGTPKAGSEKPAANKTDKTPSNDKPRQDTKKQTGLSEEAKNELNKAVIKAQAQIQGAENMINKYPRTVKNIKGELEKIIADSKNLIKEANKLLNK